MPGIDSTYDYATNSKRVLVVDSATGSPVSLSAPPASLTINTDTSFIFSKQISHLEVQNNSTTPVGIEFDAAASAGSTQVPSNSTLFMDISVTVVHMYSAAATNVNGTSANNIVLKGWS